MNNKVEQLEFLAKIKHGFNLYSCKTPINNSGKFWWRIALNMHQVSPEFKQVEQAWQYVLDQSSLKIF